MSFDPILWDYGPNFEGPDDPNSIAGSGRHANLSLKDRWPGSRQGVRGFYDGQHIVDLVTVNLDPDLIAIAALSGTGIAVRTAANAWALRTLQAPAAGLTITNPAGVAGDMTFALANDLAALEGLASTGIAVRTAADTWAQRTIAVGSGLAIADAGGVAGNPTVTLDATLVSLAAFNTNGLLTQTAADTFTGRTLQAPAAGFSITNPAGIAGDPTFALTNDLSAVEGLSGTGFGARTGTDAWSVRTLTAPAAGLSITNPAGVAGDPTFALANDLAALEGLASTGIPARTATDTWALRTITGTASQVTVTNGDGVSGNPTVSLPDSIVVGSAGGGTAAETIRGEGSVTITVARYSTDATQAQISTQKARGTIASPSDVATSDVLGQFQCQGYGGGFRFGGDIRVVATAATPSSTDMQSRVEIRAAAAGSVSATEIARFETANGLSMFGANIVIDASRLFRARSYTVATLPGTPAAGAIAYCSNETGGAVQVFGDGTNWRRVTDRAVAT